MDPDASVPVDEPSVFNYVLSFLLVGIAWGFTTPFIRRAAADFNARQEALQKPQSQMVPQTQSAQSTEEQELQDQNQGVACSTKNGHGHESEEDQDSESGEEDQPLTGRSTAASTAAAEGSSRVPAWMKPKSTSSWLKTKIVTVFWTVFNLLRTPAYSVPLVINLTGSIWFFLLVGKHGMSSLSHTLHTLPHLTQPLFFLLLTMLISHRVVINRPIGEFECIPLYGPRGVVC
jgi:hypothetical protein